MARQQLQIGSKVLGKTSTVKNYIGEVTTIVGEGHQKRYHIQWENGKGSGDYAKRSLSLLPLLPQNYQAEHQEEEDHDEDEDQVEEEDEKNDEGAGDDEDGEEFLLCHGQRWVHAEEVINDTSPQCTIKAKMLLNQVEELKVATDRMREIDYYYLMYPMEETFGEMLTATNRNLRKKGLRETDKTEITRFFGIRLTMILDTRRGSIANYWNKTADPGSVFQAQNYGERFKMAKNRFEAIHACWALTMPEDTATPIKDPWHDIRLFIDGFNHRRANCLKPGRKICVDESMSFWSGLTAECCCEGLPHSSSQPRKPANQGTELKSCADVETGIILRLDIQEGKDVMSTKPFRCPPHNYNAGTACVLRLTEPWHNSDRRIIVADSGFGSVEALIACSERGLSFIGAVKQAYRRFPKKFLKDWYDNQDKTERGSFNFVSSTYVTNNEEKEMYAGCWQDTKPTMIVFNAGCEREGSPSVRKRSYVETINNERITRKSEVSVKRPKVIEEYYEGFSAIDVHDHSRQGTLAGEKRWQTETWWHRLYCTVWGVILYDAYLAYAMIYKQRYHTYEGCLKFITFLGRLAYQMIFPETQNPSTMEQQENQDDDNDEEEHQLVTTRYASEILNEKKGEDEWSVSCDECGTRTSFFCMGCSDIQNRNLVGLCSKEGNPKSRCWNNHKRKP